MTTELNQFIFYTDAHHGPISGGRGRFDPKLYGPTALDLQFAINHFAETNGIKLIIHGGDECAFTPDLTQHFQRAQTATIPLRDFGGHVIRIAGNHDDQHHFNDLGFSKAGIQKNIILPDTRIVVGTDEIIEEDGRPVYAFNEKSTCKSIEHRRLKNIISTLVGAHAAYDRSIIAKYPYDFGPKDKGYLYRQNSEKIYKTLCELGARNPGAVLSLHGHEHGFRLTEENGYRCLTMPALVQEDRDHPERPCGLFCIIERDPITGIFNIHGKQVLLDLKEPETPEKSVIRDYSLEAMNDNYYRRYNVFGPHSRNVA